jgi:adenine-specific DNA-methyltransferase
MAKDKNMTNQRTIKQSLVPSTLKLKIVRSDLNHFKAHLKYFISSINLNESEEFHKILLIDFFKHTFYQDKYQINTNDRADLVIRNTKENTSPIKVIIETKNPSNPAEMISCNNLNKKALQELLLYYLRERVIQQNLHLTYLIVTNFKEWFVFDAQEFDKFFFKSKELVDLFVNFEAKKLSITKTEDFYREIAAPYLEKIKHEIEFTYFSLQNYQSILENDDPEQDHLFVPLFKFLMPEHLLKQPFANDNNILNKEFYNELLHILGLTEIKENGKKFIRRKPISERYLGSLLEQTILQLETLGKIKQLENIEQFGDTTEQQLFAIALELVITWINRILFLKLLESQLLTYHKKNKEYSFLNVQKIKNFWDLNNLFFQVLACKPEERNELFRQRFQTIPYLNSSLFELTTLEHQIFCISCLNSQETLPIFQATVLKDRQGKKRVGEIEILAYLFEFLDAYDFASESKEKIQEESKILISSSVLGLIFEKINGYQDGSFFTPSIITMYMSRETVRLAILQKFKEQKDWDCNTIEELYEKITDKKEANAIINSLKICDPAVGSGHFLVSVLNEIITVKSELRILLDRHGIILRDWHAKVSNDELVISDEDGELFNYRPKGEESNRVQAALFHEKQTLIENCLFGVDINPNSVKICRLRLWIELLKNAYYNSSNQLETLPNIDINIQCGNSLISRFSLDVDLKKLLEKNKININDYKQAFHRYQNAKNPGEKLEMERFIIQIKQKVKNELYNTFPKMKQLNNLSAERNSLTQQISVIKETTEEKKLRLEQIKKLDNEIIKLNEELEKIKNNKFYRNALEWRFELPEILNNQGDFIGFDLIIGNPPYIDIKQLSNQNQYVKFLFNSFNTAENRINLYSLFIEKAHDLIHEKGILAFINPNSLLLNSSYQKIRAKIVDDVYKIIKLPDDIFEHAVVETMLLFLQKNNQSNQIVSKCFKNNEIFDVTNLEFLTFNRKSWRETKNIAFNIFATSEFENLILKLELNVFSLGQFVDFSLGITPYDKYKGHSEDVIKNRRFHADNKIDENYVPLISGKNIIPYFISNEVKEYLSYGHWLGAPREKRFFSQPRIIIRQIISNTYPMIYAGYTDEELYHSQIGFVILERPHSGIKLKYILAILNSKLMNFYHKFRFLDVEKGTFQKILIQNCKLFPIKKCSEMKQLSLIELVNKIIEGKKVGLETIEWERHIDRLVYQLYDLTEKEIETIENAFIS